MTQFAKTLLSLGPEEIICEDDEGLYLKVGFVKEYDVGTPGRNMQDPIDYWYLVYTGTEIEVWRGLQWNMAISCGFATRELRYELWELLTRMKPEIQTDSSGHCSALQLQLPPPPEIITYNDE
jgi:hypothetical protein